MSTILATDAVQEQEQAASATCIIEAPASSLEAALSNTLLFVGSITTVPVLANARLTVTPGLVRLVATDRFGLIETTLDDSDQVTATGSLTTLMPIGMVKDLVRLLKPINRVRLEIVTHERVPGSAAWISASISGSQADRPTILTADLTDSKYPDLSMVTADAQSTPIGTERFSLNLNLLSSVAKVKPLTSGKSKAVRPAVFALHGTNKAVTVTVPAAKAMIVVMPCTLPKDWVQSA